ncbi:hypothetical protein [Kingella kingae]|nr:hypothetical protein [Kingella kingae]
MDVVTDKDGTSSEKAPLRLSDCIPNSSDADATKTAAITALLNGAFI